MDTYTQPVRPKRRYLALEQKRRMVEETLAEGASVAQVARVHGVNANLKVRLHGILRPMLAPTLPDLSRLDRDALEALCYAREGSAFPSIASNVLILTESDQQSPLRHAMKQEPTADSHGSTRID